MKHSPNVVKVAFGLTQRSCIGIVAFQPILIDYTRPEVIEMLLVGNQIKALETVSLDFSRRGFTAVKLVSNLIGSTALITYSRHETASHVHQTKETV